MTGKNKTIIAVFALILLLANFAIAEEKIGPYIEPVPIGFKKTPPITPGTSDKCKPVIINLKLGDNVIESAAGINATFWNSVDSGKKKVEFDKGKEMQVKFKAGDAKEKCPIYQYTLELWTTQPGTPCSAGTACSTFARIQLASEQSKEPLNKTAEVIVTSSYKLDSSTKVFIKGSGETTLGQALGSFEGSKSLWLRIETWQFAEAPEKKTDGKWLDSDALPLSFTKPTVVPPPPTTTCSTILECLAQIDKWIVDQLLGLKKNP